MDMVVMHLVLDKINVDTDRRELGRSCGVLHR